MSTAAPSEQTEESVSFPIAGIGASAGGLEALQELLAALPPTPNMALLVVQHLDPTRESLLAEILARKTRVPVAQATEGVEVKANHIYVIPPNTSMTFSRGRLHVTQREDTAGQHMPVDLLFNSLAQDRGKNAIGVILSGSGSDGSLGLEKIKSEGGITFAQDLASAKFDGMPRSAINHNCVDFILPPREIAEELLEITDHPYLKAKPMRPHRTKNS